MVETNRRAMTPQDITRIRFISEPQMAPDEQHVACVVTTLCAERDEYLANIWLVDHAGEQSRRFTTGAGRDTSPRWSPDGRYLAFLSEREPGHKSQLYVMPANGGEPVRLTDLPNGVADPVWSPDSTRLAFTSRVGGEPEAKNPDAHQHSRPARVITTMKYKANGDGFIYDRQPHIFVVSASADTPCQQISDGDWADTDPAWSPDGQSIAFVSARHADRDDNNAADIWIVPATGGTPRQITDTAGPVSLPAFAPDGHTVAYLGHRYKHDSGRNTRLFTVPAAGGPSICMTADVDRTCAPFFGHTRPMWSPDGKWLFCLVEDQGNNHVYRVHATADTAPERTVAGERQVTDVSLTRDGQRLVFTAATPVAPAEVFLCNADGTGERQLSTFNQAWQAEVALSPPQRFSYRRDGYDLDCWVMRPYGFTPEERYPALLSIHGGPHLCYGNTFFDEFQVYAGAGYVVIYTNPRGSQGYGEAFSRAVLGDWGGGDFADVMAGLEEALRRCDFIDPERLGVMGGSYGGFLTSWTVGHTQRFKAACSERAANSPYTLFGTSDIGHTFSEAESGYLPWENMQWYIEHAPLTYSKDIQTPLLIIHSEDDLRCPIEQAEQLFIALKKQHKEVLFVRFPDENHELSRSGRPRHRLERFRYILEWFAKYI